jgi:phosphoglycolate phosphatase-like HAD superfamily hydrolase
MIGDSESDVQAGKNAGCKTARILDSDEVATGTPDLFAASLFEAVREILRAESQPKPAVPCGKK